jgi:hypothetical protein
LKETTATSNNNGGTVLYGGGLGRAAGQINYKGLARCRLLRPAGWVNTRVIVLWSLHFKGVCVIVAETGNIVFLLLQF